MAVYINNDADRIKGVEVDDSAIADGLALAYDAGTNTIVYTSLAYVPLTGDSTITGDVTIQKDDATLKLRVPNGETYLTLQANNTGSGFLLMSGRSGFRLHPAGELGYGGGIEFTANATSATFASTYNYSSGNGNDLVFKGHDTSSPYTGGSIYFRPGNRNGSVKVQNDDGSADWLTFDSSGNATFTNYVHSQVMQAIQFDGNCHSIGGMGRGYWVDTQVVYPSDASVNWSSSASYPLGSSLDLRLRRTAASTLTLDDGAGGAALLKLIAPASRVAALKVTGPVGSGYESHTIELSVADDGDGGVVGSSGPKVMIQPSNAYGAFEFISGQTFTAYPYYSISPTSTLYHAGHSITWTQGANNIYDTVDLRLTRSGTSTLKLDDGAGGAADLSVVGRGRFVDSRGSFGAVGVEIGNSAGGYPEIRPVGGAGVGYLQLNATNYLQMYGTSYTGPNASTLPQIWMHELNTGAGIEIIPSFVAGVPLLSFGATTYGVGSDFANIKAKNATFTGSAYADSYSGYSGGNITSTIPTGQYWRYVLGNSSSVFKVVNSSDQSRFKVTDSGVDLTFGSGDNGDLLVWGTSGEHSALVDRARIRLNPSGLTNFDQAHIDSTLLVGGTSGGTTNIVVRGNTSQTANLTEWQNVGGTALASISAAGGGSFRGPTSVDISALSTGVPLTLKGNSVGGTPVLEIYNGGNGIRAFYVTQEGTVKTDNIVANSWGATSILMNDGNITLTPQAGKVGIGGTPTTRILELHGVNPYIRLNNNGAHSSLVEFQISGTSVAYAGVSAGTDAIVTGAVAGDYVVRTTGSNSILWSNDNGASAQMKLTTAGNLTVAGSVAASKRITSGMVNAGTVSSGTYAADCTASNEARLTLSNNVTINAPSGTPVDGQGLVYRIAQDSTGGWTISFSSSFRWANGSAPTMANTASKAVYIATEYVAADSKWDIIGFTGEF